MDAYSTALTLMGRRELSTAQLRDRLARRRFPPQVIADVVRRLTEAGVLDDRRVALAAARREILVKRRGRRRVIQQLLHQGLSAQDAAAAMDELYAELDEDTLLDQALHRRLRGVDLATLDTHAVARLTRALVAQGFDRGQVYARLRRHDSPGEES
ncbi:MAG: regulatory protein RecX [Acidobacteriota bacterium]